MDDSVANALKRRAEIERELVDIDLFLALHRRYAGTNTETGAAQPLERASENAYTPEEAAAAEEAIAQSKPRGRPADFVRIMEGILKDVQRPLSRGEFVEQIEKRGHVIPSEDKPRYLGTILWRNGKIFENHEGRGYWLAGKPLPKSRDVDIFEEFNVSKN
jgi:hypothetical protein